MDIKEEHNEFFHELDGRGFIFQNKKWLGGCFEDDQLQVVWEMWQAAKAQAVPEGFVLVNAEQLNQWGHMANAAEQYGCCDCFESRGYAHNLACEINSYFEPVEAQEQSHE